jgi:fucose permease
MTKHDSETRRPIDISLVSVVLGVGFISGLIPAGLLPANVLNIEQAYGLSHGEVGRIIGLTMVLGGAIGGLIAGWICSRVGAVRTVLISLVLAAASLGITGLIHSLAATVVGLTGYFFSMGFLSSSNALAAGMLPDSQRGVTLLHAMNGVGKLTGPVLASIFLYGAWRSGFVSSAAVPLFLAIPAWLVYRSGKANSIGRTREGASHAGIYFWSTLLGFGLISGAEISAALWTPAYAQKSLGFSAAQGNMLLVIMTLGFVSGRFIASALSTRLSPRQMIGVCGVLIVSVVPFLLLRSYFPLAIATFFFGMSFCVMWPSYFSHLSSVFPDHVGLMSGVAVLPSQVGFAAGSWISGRLAEIQLSYAILFGAVIMGAFVLLFFLLPVSRISSTDHR